MWINIAPLRVRHEELCTELIAIPYPDVYADSSFGELSQWATAGLGNEMASGIVEYVTECIRYGIIGSVIRELMIDCDSVAGYGSVLVMPEGESVSSLIAKTPRGELRRLSPSVAATARCLKVDQIHPVQVRTNSVNHDYHPPHVTGSVLIASELLETLKRHLRNRIDAWVDLLCRLPGSGFPGHWVEYLARNVMPVLAASNVADLATFRNFCDPLSESVSKSLGEVEQALGARWSGPAGVHSILARRNLTQALREYPLLSFGYDV